MPDGSVVKQLLFAEGLVGVGRVAGHAPRGRLLQLRAQLSCPGWRGGVGMGWLRTARSGNSLVSALSPLFDPSALLR
eukprot:357241-Chlamydomonas_euryale.AAC.17